MKGLRHKFRVQAKVSGMFGPLGIQVEVMDTSL